MRIGLLVAMRTEIPAFLDRRSAGSSGSAEFGSASLAWRVSGIGQRRARAAMLSMCREYAPAFVLSTGFCGAVQDGMQIGDLVIVEAVRHAGKTLGLHTNWSEALASSPGAAARIGKLETRDRVAFDRTGIPAEVMAVDMETFAVAQAAYELGIDLVAARVVSDCVPAGLSFASFAAWLRSLREDRSVAKQRLDSFVEAYLSAPAAWPVAPTPGTMEERLAPYAQ